jgi:hypothetical protein
MSTAKLAVFNSKNEKINFTLYGTEAEEKYMSNMIRVSEYVEVEFTLLPEDTLIPVRVAAIDEEIENIQKEAMDKIVTLKQRKQELLALSHTAEHA